MTIPVSLGGGGFDSETWECREAGAVGFILAGGQSRRMGTDKALVEFMGRPLLAHAVDIVRAAGLPVFIAGARSPLESFAPVVLDSRTGAGPLEGICAALKSLKDLPDASGPESRFVSGHDFSRAVRAEEDDGALAPGPPYAVFLPVDLPLLPPSLLQYLVYQAHIKDLAVTLPSVNGFAQTFPVVLSLDCLLVLERELSSGHGSCYAAFQAAAAGRGESVSIVSAEVLVQSRKITHPAALPVARWFLNVNAPADLRRASAIGAGRVS